jgi:hypothetical protein
MSCQQFLQFIDLDAHRQFHAVSAPRVAAASTRDPDPGDLSDNFRPKGIHINLMEPNLFFHLVMRSAINLP